MGSLNANIPPTPPTISVKSSSKLPDMLFRPSLTKAMVENVDLHHRLSVTANQIQQKSHQKGSEVISQQFFEAVTPSLVCLLGTLFRGCPPKTV